MSYPNVKTCLRCRKGIDTFMLKEDTFMHIDLFATAEAGEIVPCGNSDWLKENIDQLELNQNNGIYIAKGDLKGFYTSNSFWWEDMIDLAYETFMNAEEVHKFFVDKVNEMSNLEIENLLVELAKNEGIEVNKEQFPDLIHYKIV